MRHLEREFHECTNDANFKRIIRLFAEHLHSVSFHFGDNVACGVSVRVNGFLILLQPCE